MCSKTDGNTAKKILNMLAMPKAKHTIVKSMLSKHLVTLLSQLVGNISSYMTNSFDFATLTKKHVLPL